MFNLTGFLKKKFSKLLHRVVNKSEIMTWKRHLHYRNQSV